MGRQNLDYSSRQITPNVPQPAVPHFRIAAVILQFLNRIKFSSPAVFEFFDGGILSGRPEVKRLKAIFPALFYFLPEHQGMSSQLLVFFLETAQERMADLVVQNKDVAAGQIPRLRL